MAGDESDSCGNTALGRELCWNSKPEPVPLSGFRSHFVVPLVLGSRHEAGDDHKKPNKLNLEL